MKKEEFIEEGVRFCSYSPPSYQNKSVPGLILDRDGVLVKEIGYLHKIEDLVFEEGAFSLLKKINNLHIPLMIATNQSGIDRGLYSWKDYIILEEKINETLNIQGCVVDGVIACSYHPDFTPLWSEKKAYFRKPGEGMLITISKKCNIDLSKSWMVGDKESDIISAKKAGLKGAIHLLTGHGKEERRIVANNFKNDPSFTVLFYENLQEIERNLDYLFAPDMNTF